MGVNSRIQLAQATKVMQRRINGALMASGVTMLDPDQVWVGPGVEVGRDTVLLPGTMLWGATRIGEGCVVGPRPASPTRRWATAAPSTRRWPKTP